MILKRFKINKNMEISKFYLENLLLLSSYEPFLTQKSKTKTQLVYDLNKCSKEVRNSSMSGGKLWKRMIVEKVRVCILTLDYVVLCSAVY